MISIPDDTELECVVPRPTLYDRRVTHVQLGVVNTGDVLLVLQSLFNLFRDLGMLDFLRNKK